LRTSGALYTPYARPRSTSLACSAPSTRVLLSTVTTACASRSRRRGGCHRCLPPPLPAAVEVAAYRIVQEALTNVVRHAHASECVVRLALDETVETLRLEIRDDGRGLPSERGRGVGVASMRERAAELGGECVVESFSAVGGTRVRASLPCTPGAGAVDAQLSESEA
jgi:signal transduction histidine kinase